MQNSSEASLALDTYASEATSVNVMENSSVEIKMEGVPRQIQNQVYEILTDNKIISSTQNPTILRSEIRQLAKYGDRFYKFFRYDPQGPILIRPITNQSDVTVVRDPRIEIPVAYTYKDKSRGWTRDEYYPWEISQFVIHDETFAPYGRSTPLEPMRAAYQQLLINEALMAMSRSSRVSKLVVKVPAGGTNPAATFEQLTHTRSIFKNLIFGNSGTGYARNRVSPLTDVLWMPSGAEWGIDTLKSEIDVSGIDDVLYFRDKYLMASRLPKSYLIADADQYRIAAGALALQDIKFARALLPLQYAYSEGLNEVITTILILLDQDPTRFKVTVSLIAPDQLSAEILGKASDSITVLDGLLKSFLQSTGYVAVEPEAYCYLASEFSGLPLRIFQTLAEAAIPPAPPEMEDGMSNGQSSYQPKGKVSLKNMGSRKNGKRNKELMNNSVSARRAFNERFDRKQVLNLAEYIEDKIYSKHLRLEKHHFYSDHVLAHWGIPKKDIYTERTRYKEQFSLVEAHTEEARKSVNIIST